MGSLRNILFNVCVGMNAFLLFLVFFGNAMEIPVWLQVGGRLHPMILHFPIALLVISVFWELLPSATAIDNKNLIGDFLLLTTAFFSVSTAIMGLLLSKESAYDTDAISLHKWFGIATATGSLVWYLVRNTLRRNYWLKVFTGLVLLGCMVSAGHQGAVITHGDNFILAPVYHSTKNNLTSEDAFLYADIVQPILEQKCYGCHNEKKAKGGLVMQPVHNMVRGGEHGVLFDSLNPDKSLLIHHLNLPLADDAHMPPAEKPQLSILERKVIIDWVLAGADFEMKVAELPESDSLRILAATFLLPEQADVYAFEAADEKVIEKLNTDYRLVEPLYVHSPALHVEFFGASSFTGIHLRDLLVVRDQIVSLNLNGMPVEDSDLKTIGQFHNLQKLNLSRTAITGATFAELKSLRELQQLAVTGTRVGVDALVSLGDLKKLTKLFVWNTPLSKEDLKVLHRKMPSVQMDTGFNGDTIRAKLSPPQLADGDEIFSSATRISLTHAVNGTEIRYTLDGTQPDSIAADVYGESAIVIDKPTRLRAKAYLKGWIASDEVVFNFYKAGYLPDSSRLITQPNPDYDGSGSSTLFDKRKGTINFRTPQWLGYREHPMQVEIRFDNPRQVTSATISCLIDLNSYIFPGTRFEVWCEDANGKLQLIKELVPKQPVELQPPYLTNFILAFPPHTTRKIQIIGKPVGRLPDWHPGKGDKGWIFVDEIFLN